MALAPKDVVLKSACCTTWTNPVARLLLGDRLHPGGEKTTALTVDSIGLEPGAMVLDLGCGYGSTLGTLAQQGYAATGLDLAPEAAAEASASGRVVVADAERPPVRDGSFDAIVMECVLSLLPDKREAMFRARSALREGGRIALSDVTIERPVPLALEEVTAWSTCVAGALPAAGYSGLLQDTGFGDVESISLDDELLALIDQIRRRLALIEVALTAAEVELATLGMDRDRLETLRRLAAGALDFIRSGGAGYRLFHATKR
jgi:SAM-dependent methyltransferase